ncbi:hypothetical protein KHS38_12860 [Mucilaginibacter sp. Bleaf8]|uniref:hypothetical protein n=1 Tax=Mucilaginibacter sp. Bleaf8 TaxID=2834430 RepID=UPI001BCF740C|nr:hypothetical protein [Mucilaginibacter sp. Bleaf8]MBS7565297.1 hypothetical protein [Mucilaginibacter sp. Bleaf8]
MKKLITKLQYKNFERGEFISEQYRTLEETHELIKQYPWDTQRHFTDIEPTGPSVTIDRGRGEYLKIGLYFNQKFCLYLFNRHNSLYEYHTASQQEVYDIVTKFFSDANLEPSFEKHLISIGSESHFKNKNFLYSLNTGQIIAKYILLLLLTACILCSLTIATIIFFPAGTLLLLAGYGLFKFHSLYLSHYQKSKNVGLKLSRGINEFTYSKNGVSKTYNKTDIKQIDVFSSASNTKNSDLIFYQIIFNDSTEIRISGQVIAQQVFVQKFPGMLFHYRDNLFKKF